MAKRIFEIAKEINISSKEIINFLNKEYNLNISSHMKRLEEDVELIIKKKFGIETEKQEEKDIVEKEIEDTKETIEEEKKEQEDEKKVVNQSSSQVIEDKRKVIKISDPISVRELADKLDKSPIQIIKKLMELGIIASINQKITAVEASLLIEEEGFKPEVVEIFSDSIEEKVDEKKLSPRPPVVTIMGHVDHGKTLLLDYIRKTNVVAREAGGITQSIGAYKVKLDKGEITFIDTPGHEAFTAMRARGSLITDIVVLVVAADDGVKPQTVEAINHIKAANVQMIVAINKIDKPEANPTRVKQQLTEYNVVPEDWGGDIITVEVSAKTGQNIDELLDLIMLQAEMMELKSVKEARAKGVVIEAALKKGKGPTATVIIKQGTLNQNDFFVSGLTYGKVKAMFDDKGNRINKALPSDPVEIMGFDSLPEPGDPFEVVENEKKAKEIYEQRNLKKNQVQDIKLSKKTLDDLLKQSQEQEVKDLNIIIKGDTFGVVESIKSAIERIEHKELKVEVLHSGVGEITDADVMLASASNALIFGFNVKPTAEARRRINKEKVVVKTYKIIYELLEDVKRALEGLLEPDIEERVLGTAEIRKVYKIAKIGKIAGCFVKDGIIKRNALARLIRDNQVIYDGKIISLKRFKDDVKEVQAGYECGIVLNNFDKIAENDEIQCYEKIEIKKTIE